jgi:hypothetical protein
MSIAKLVTGHVMMVGVPSRDGRIYSKAAIGKALEEYNKLVESGQAYAYLNGSYDPSLEESELTPMNASHVVRRLQMINGSMVGVFELLDTIPGKMLQQYIANGQAEFKMRGIGRVLSDMRVTDFTIESIDAVKL